MNANQSDQNVSPNTNRLLMPEEVAELLSISRSFAYQLLQTGEIPVVRLGRACRVRPQDLAEFIERNLHHRTDQG